jgi:hypothetical protein
MAHIEAAPNIGQGFAIGPPLDGLSRLVLGQLGLPAELNASRLCARTPITGPGEDQ